MKSREPCGAYAERSPESGHRIDRGDFVMVLELAAVSGSGIHMARTRSTRYRFLLGRSSFISALLAPDLLVKLRCRDAAVIGGSYEANTAGGREICRFRTCPRAAVTVRDGCVRVSLSIRAEPLDSPQQRSQKLIERLFRGGLADFKWLPQVPRQFIAGLPPAAIGQDFLLLLDPAANHHASPVLRRLFSNDPSPGGIAAVFVPFLKWLGSDEFSLGTYVRPRDKIVEEIAGIPGLLEASVECVAQGQLAAEHLIPLTWFFEKFACAPGRQTCSLSKPHLLAMADLLAQPFRPASIRDAAARMLGVLCPLPPELKTVASKVAATPEAKPAASASIADMASRKPGGRHSNDHENYRLVAVLPTVGEAECKAAPFLPTPNDEWPMLDRLFRLLREDMVSGLREVIATLAPTEGDKKPRRKLWLYENVVLHGFVTAGYNSELFFKISFAIPDKHPAHYKLMKKKKERVDYWGNGRGKKTFGKDTLVYIARADNLGHPLFIGQVTYRDEAILALAPPKDGKDPKAPQDPNAKRGEEEFPWLGVRFADQASTQAALEMLLTADHNLRLVHVNLALFSFEPVLKRLQVMPAAMFAELDDQIRVERSRPVECAYAGKFTHKANEYRRPGGSAAAMMLDLGQQDAVVQALTQRVTLVQGPPGTGKTFVGVRIAQLLLEDPAMKILCVTYTNHALDDFLHGLEKEGITDIVRVGGKVNDPAVLCYSLIEKKKMLGKGAKWTRNMSQRCDSLKASLRAVEVKLLATQEELKIAAGKSLLHSWATVKQFLDLEMDPELEFLTVHIASAGDFEQVGADGKKIRDDYLWQKWLNGEPKPKNMGIPGGGSCWDLDKNERKGTAEGWLRHRLDELRGEVTRLRSRADDFAADLRDVFRQTEHDILRNSRVVMCTTTGAAKNHELLQGAGCKVLLVEEAGEILESHVLASLYEGCESLIMIGDHLQLRPKVESYNLRFESGRGYNLNVSLFERLIHAKYPAAVLTTQHRMHPDISMLIKGPTYPSLLDGPKVHLHPLVRGLASRVAFVDHRCNEGTENAIQQEDSTSYVNQHEVDMCTATVKYLQQQGYAESEMVVLTPYLAQMRALALSLKAQMSKADFRDLSRFIPDPLTGLPPPAKSAVRVATIDNYQGEESDIVIISLVRSNTKHMMGFVGDTNRVNVLLSRARNGLIIFGNAEFLCSVKNAAARALWTGIVEKLKHSAKFFAGLPAQCQSHGTLSLVALPSEFATKCPDGGCSLACTTFLTCDHACPRKCHTTDMEHKLARCNFTNSRQCSGGTHTISWKCGGIEPLCNECVEARKRDELKLEAARVAAEKRAKVQQEVDARLAKLAQEREELEQEHAHRKALLDKEAQVKRELLENQRRKQKLEVDHQSQVAESVAAEAQLSNALAAQEAEDESFVEKQRVLTMETEEVHGLAELGTAATEGDLSKFLEKLRGFSSSQRSAVLARLVPLVGSRACNWFGELHPISDSTRKTIAHSFTLLGKNPPTGISAHFKEWEKKRNVYSEGHLLFARVAQVFANACIARTSSVKELDKALQSESSLERGDYSLVTVMECFTRAYLIDLAANANKAEAAALAVTFHRFATAAKVLDHHYWLNEAKRIFKANGAALSEAMMTRKLRSEATAAPSPSEDELLRKEWVEKKGKYNFASVGMDKLMSMAALGALKRQMLRVVDGFFFDKAQGSNPRKGGFNLRFEGNPGTGKTTAAQLYADLLADLGITGGAPAVAARPPPAANNPAAMAAAMMAPQPAAPRQFVETSGAELAQGGASELQKQLDSIAAAGGGLLFVDEAYMLEPNSIAGQGKQALNLLLAEMEKRRGSLVVVFAGYKEQMDQLMRVNEGLVSRFSNTVTFEDYSDKQLFDIFRNMMKMQGGSKPLRFEGDNPHWGLVTIRRLGAGRATKGFGNARSVRKLFETVRNRLAERWAKNPSIAADVLTKYDLVGHSSLDAGASSAAWRKLKGMTGLAKVKQSVESLFEVVKSNEEMDLQLRPRQDVALNRIFLGNPGTGKTSVAKLYAEILRDFGLLSKGKVVMKAASDFVGNVLGESQTKTRSILEEAEGCVLVIDEAYGLSGNDPYKSAAVDTIVEQIQGVPGEDRCVVMLGYREQMAKMLRESNPGLQRRFQLENAFEFEDFDDNQLLEIMRLRMAEKELTTDAAALVAALEVLNIIRTTQPPFGNGGAVANLLSEAIMRKAKRAGSSPQIIATDFKPEGTAAEETTETLFSGLIGCAEVAKVLTEYRAIFLKAKLMGQDPLKKCSLNFRFTGAPGTGKTTVARRMGRMFKSLGVLPTAEVREICARDLIAQYVGQTAPLTTKELDAALGKVLFIDEAYALRGSVFGQEAIDTLVASLTQEKYQYRLVVILAGYPDDIASLMALNEGLKSRFDYEITFKSFDSNESCQLMRLKLADPEVNLALSPDAEATLLTEMSRLVGAPNFANGRDIGNWIRRLERRAAVQDPTGAAPLSVADLTDTLEVVLKDKENVPRPERPEVMMLPPVAAAPPVTLQVTAPAPVSAKPKAAARGKAKQSHTAAAAGPPSPSPTGPTAGTDDDGLCDLIQEYLFGGSDNGNAMWNDPVFLGKVSLPLGASAGNEIAKKQAEMREFERRKKEYLATEALRVLEHAAKVRAVEESIKTAQEEARQAAAEAERKKKEEEVRRLQEEQRRILQEEARRLQEKQALNAQLRQKSRCPMGFDWIPIDPYGGYRCLGGTHFATI